MKFPFKITLPKFKITPKSCLGIDIGTSLIKIVGLAKSGNRIKLENYGETSALALYEEPFRTFEKNTLYLSNAEVVKAIRAILEEGKIKTRDVIMSIPDFSSFFTNFELPPMKKEEIPQAVQYEAPQHIPLPLSEVVIDWQIINTEASEKKGAKIKILLVAVPNEAISQYQEIAKLCGLNLQGFEAEAFSFARAYMNSLREKSQHTIALIDIGAQSTSCSIIERGVIQISHSFDIAGNELTETLAKSLGIDYKEANSLKNKYGLNFLKRAPEGNELPSDEKSPKKVAETIATIIDSILIGTSRAFQSFSQLENKKIQKIILGGGTASLPGLREYASLYLKTDAEIINPFENIFYPPVLEKYLRESGPAYAIAIGAALRVLG